ncbi:MAG: 2-isopropylmalate synthase [Enterobacterales bacterium]|nr:2-isopropylmalate synthase [Enterobacterales bacterium]
MADNLIIFDTTLRDGEQALQASLSSRDKLQIALAIERLGVDIIEAGFPISSPGDLESVRLIGQHVKNSRVAGLSRAIKSDIDAVNEALHNAVAGSFRIHTFIATSDIHVENKLRMDFEQILEMTKTAVTHARNYTDDVEFSCEDAGRTPIDNLCRTVETAIAAGARTINIPDTVGYTIPTEFGGIISQLFNRVPNIDQAIISVHCHDDLGLSVANSIAAIQAGARQVEGTINGIGERAGNCALEEIVMILNTRRDQFGIETNIKTQEIHRTSQLVANLCNMPIQSNKAVVGTNAFSHSSGIHQDGVLKSENTYEIMTPESVGIQTNQLNLTSRSGRHVIKHRMAELGYDATDFDLDELYADFLTLADKKGQVFDYDLEAIALFNNLSDADEHFQLNELSVQSGTDKHATATVTMSCGDSEVVEAANGNGPINSICRCLSRITGYDLEIKDFKVASKSTGMDALGQVSLVVDYNGYTFHGMGLATDIILSAARALVHVVNEIFKHQQVTERKLKNKSINKAAV